MTNTTLTGNSARGMPGLGGGIANLGTATINSSKGLGFTSMRERVRLVGGTIAIDSKPMGGTTIDVRVPLGSENTSQRAAGVTESILSPLSVRIHG